MFGKKRNFEVDFEVKQNYENALSVSTNLGRPATTIATAKQYHVKQDRTNPIPHIKQAAQDENIYFGQTFEDNKPFTIPADNITHSIFFGSTGSGKGVAEAAKVYQSIHEKRGVIIVDPKGDAYLPQVILEKLAEDGRPETDFKMIYFPHLWRYKMITERDSYLEISNKLIDLFGYEPTESAGSDYYRQNGRILLRFLMKIFFVDLDLKVHIKKDFEDIKKHIILLKQDLENRKMYEKQLEKTRPNAQLMEKFSKRFYNPKLIESIYFSNTDIETLDDLAKKFIMTTEGMTFQNDIDIAEALYDGKILYFRIDMNNIESCKFPKLLISDIIQNATKRRGNCDCFFDELSFYASQNLSGILATSRSMGVQFNLYLQAVSQLPEQVRNPILENCNVKQFYKTSDLDSLNLLEKLGGVEAITKISTKDGVHNFSQDYESYLNATKIRALPRTTVGIVISEWLSIPQILQTNFIETKQEFDWSQYSNIQKEKYKDIKADTHLADDKKATKSKLEKYRVYLKESKSLLENSDLMSISLGSELI